MDAVPETDSQGRPDNEVDPFAALAAYQRKAESQFHQLIVKDAKIQELAAERDVWRRRAEELTEEIKMRDEVANRPKAVAGPRAAVRPRPANVGVDQPLPMAEEEAPTPGGNRDFNPAG